MKKSAKPIHDIGDLVMKRFTLKKETRYFLGVIKVYRTKFNGHATAYPWGVYWVNQEVLTSDGCKYYTASEITRFKNILSEYIKTV